MIEMYCDGCGVRIIGKRYIKATINVGDAKDVEVHAYAPSGHDLCRNCLVSAVSKAKVKT